MLPWAYEKFARKVNEICEDDDRKTRVMRERLAAEFRLTKEDVGRMLRELKGRTPRV